MDVNLLPLLSVASLAAVLYVSLEMMSQGCQCHVVLLRYSRVRYSGVQCGTAQCSAVEHSAVWYGTRYSRVQYGTAQHSAAQWSTARCGMVLGTVQ